MKDSIEIKVKKGKLVAAFIVLLIWIAAAVINFTPLVQVYIINFTVNLILGNTLNIFVISGLLGGLYIVEKRMLEDKLNRYERRMR